MNKQAFTLLLFLIMLSSIFQSCKCRREPSKGSLSQTAIENTKVEVKCNIQRFEKDLFAVNIDSVGKYVGQLKSKYGEFFDIFNYKIALLGPSKDNRYPNALKRFLTDYYMNQDYKRVLKVYPDLDDLTGQLTAAFSKYKDYFPDKRVPRIYTCMSGWNQSIVTSDTILAIALDKYLGRSCDLYNKLQIENYLRYTMQREYIVPDCMKAWGYTTFEFKDSANCLLNNILYEGKIAFFVKTMLPDDNDTLIFGFTPAQLKWCTNNGGQMWTYLVGNKLLFSTNNLTIRKLVYPAPFTSYFTQESPGRASVWLGYKIIAAYMKNNKGITLPQLMQEKDYQKILRMSDFKP